MHGDGEEHVDFERLDISDFLEPDVPVSGSGLGAARAGGFPGDAGGRSGGGEDLDLDLEPPDVADCLESEVGAGFGAEGGVGAGLDDRVAVGTAHGVVKKERRRKQQHGGSGFSDSEADVGYDDGDPEDGEPESKEKAPTTRGKGGGGGPGGRRGGMKGDKAGSGSVKGGFEGLTADEVSRDFVGPEACQYMQRALLSSTAVWPGRSAGRLRSSLSFVECVGGGGVLLWIRSERVRPRPPPASTPPRPPPPPPLFFSFWAFVSGLIESTLGRPHASRAGRAKADQRWHSARGWYGNRPRGRGRGRRRVRG